MVPNYLYIWSMLPIPIKLELIYHKYYLPTFTNMKPFHARSCLCLSFKFLDGAIFVIYKGMEFYTTKEIWKMPEIIKRYTMNSRYLKKWYLKISSYIKEYS